MIWQAAGFVLGMAVAAAAVRYLHQQYEKRGNGHE